MMSGIVSALTVVGAVIGLTAVAVMVVFVIPCGLDWDTGIEEDDDDV